MLLQARTLLCQVNQISLLACYCLQDLPGALSDAQVAEGLGLTAIKSRDWSIVKTSGTGAGRGAGAAGVSRSLLCSSLAGRAGRAGRPSTARSPSAACCHIVLCSHQGRGAVRGAGLAVQHAEDQAIGGAI